MNEVLVSACVITYNQKNFIRNCLEGVIAQEMKFSYEIVISDDCSSDGTFEICLEYALKYPDLIRIIKRDENIGMIGNWRETIYSCRGKYIALCEGDDYWTDPFKLKKQVGFMEANPGYSICFHNVSIFDEINRVMLADNITRRVNETTDITDLAIGNYIHTPSVLLRNDVKIPEWFKEVTLGDWSLYMLQCGNRKIKKLEDVMAVYRISATNYWSSKSKEYRINSTLKTVEKVLEYAELSPQVKEILKKRLTNKKLKMSIIKRVLKKITK